MTRHLRTACPLHRGRPSEHVDHGHRRLAFETGVEEVRNADGSWLAALMTDDADLAAGSIAGLVHVERCRCRTRREASASSCSWRRLSSRRIAVQ